MTIHFTKTKSSNVTSILAIFLLFLFLFIPSLSLAQDVEAPGGIVSCVNNCDYNDLVQSTQNLLNFSIYFASIVAVLLFIYAGAILIFSGGNSGKKDQAKSIFWNTTVGFLIVISAWLIIATILTAFQLKDEVKTPLENIDVTEP